MAYELVRRRSYSGFGDATGDILASLKDPSKLQDIYATAAAKGKALFSSDNLKNEAYQFAYTGARALLAYANANPTVQRITQAGNSAFEAATQVSNYVSKIQSGDITLDASGIADTVGMVNSFAKSVANFATALGASQEVAQGITEWTGMVTGCAAGIAAGAATPFAIGSIVAAIGCAMSVLIKVLSAVGVRDDLANDALRAVFVPNTKQQPIIQGDALRLATLLASRYSCTTIQPLLERLNKSATFSPAKGIYPAHNPDNRQDTPVPAIDSKFLLVMMDDPAKSATQALDNVTFCLHCLTGATPVAHGYAKGPIRVDAVATQDLNKWGFFFGYDALQLLRDSMVNRGDVNATTIAFGAAVGRAQLARTGSTIFNIPGTPFVFDLLPFIRLDELLNFFVAVTLREHAAQGNTESMMLDGNLPVRVIGAAGAAKPWPYSSKCWTEGYPANIDNDTATGPLVCYTAQDFGAPDLRQLVRRENPVALKEYAMVRLQAAMSQILLQYLWSPPEGKSDTIADAAAQARKWFQLPADPRQVVPNGAGGWKFNPTGAWQFDNTNYDEAAQPTTGVWAVFHKPDVWDAGVKNTGPMVYQYPALGGMQRLDDDPLHPPLFDAVRNGQAIATAIGRLEATIAAAIIKGRQDAMADAAARGVKQLAITAPVDQGLTLASQLMTPTVAQKSLQAGTAKAVWDAVPAAVKKCLDAGGNPTFAYEGSYGPQHPVLLRGYSAGQLRLYLAGTDAKLLAKWGLGVNVPDAAVLNLYCLPQSNLGPIALLAGVALLAAKFMK